MIGTWRWNAILGLLSGLVTFVFSVSGNILLTTLLRSLYSFLIMFVLAFAFRWILGTVVGLKQYAAERAAHSAADDGNTHTAEPPDAGRGKNVDLRTPDEANSLHGLLRGQMNGQPGDEEVFSPIKPPRLVSKEKVSTEDLVKAVRRMSEDEGR